MMNTATASDCIDAAIALTPNDALHALRRQRDKVVITSQESYDAIFDPAFDGLSLAERWLAAYTVAELSHCPRLADHYKAQLTACEALAEGARSEALLRFTRTVAVRPEAADRHALTALAAVGLDVLDVVLLAQLIGFVAYQARVVLGLAALSQLDPSIQDVAVSEDVAFVHPANLPAPGEPVRIQGFTSEALDWASWLPVLDVSQASAHQLAVLKASHPTAIRADYYLLLVQQPRILEARSAAFNAIMYAPGGLSRAERELASTVVSRLNACVYCASVHALRFEQISKRNDVIVQVFTDPAQAGTTARERAIVQAAVALTREPKVFHAAHLQALSAVGLQALEILDLIYAVAVFAWANRLMLNLGEPVFPKVNPN